jgi:hypothetical protein
VVQIVIDPDRCPQSNHPHGGVALGLSSQRSRTDPSIASSPISSIIAADESVPVYAAAGYDYPGEDLDALPAELLGYLELGHTLVKIKIGGASLDEARAGSRRRLRS